jgi:tetratricopeptide (TPR) repeat protein
MQQEEIHVVGAQPPQAFADHLKRTMASTDSKLDVSFDDGGHCSMTRDVQSTFVGRDSEVRHIETMLTDAAVITILGQAGIGKTRLVSELVKRVAARFEGGAFSVVLTHARSEDDVVRGVGRTLNVPLGGDEPVGRLGALFSRRGRLLLVLDACEDIAPGVLDTIVTSWVAAAPELRILATSRSRLKLSNEAAFELLPLSTVDTEDAPAPAVALFLEHARVMTGREFRARRDDVRALVRALDGIPLAVELAAASMGVLNPSDLLARRALLLDLSSPGQPLPLRRALAAVWTRLSDIDQYVLACCAELRGAFDLPVVEALVGADVKPATLVSTLATLLEHFLLVGSEEGEARRYRMLDSVRQFALEDQTARGLTPEVRRRHAMSLGQRAREHVHSGEGRGRRAAIEWLLAFESDLTVIAQRTLEADATADAGMLESGMAASAGLAWLAMGRGPIANVTRMCRAIYEALPPGLEVNTRLLGLFLLCAGSIHRHAGDLTTAETMLRRAIELARADGDRALETRILIEQARRATFANDPALCRTLLQEARQIAQARGDTYAQTLAYFAEHPDGSTSTDDEREAAWRLAKASEDPTLMIRAETAMASWLAGMGRASEALDHLGRVATMAAELGEPSWLVFADVIAASAHADLNERGEARARLSRALDRSAVLGFPQSEGEVLGYLALLDLEECRLTAAKEHLARSQALLNRTDPLRLILVAASGALQAELGSATEENTAAREAIRLAQDRHEPGLAASVEMLASEVPRLHAQAHGHGKGAETVASAPALAPRGSLAARYAKRITDRVRDRLVARQDALEMAAGGEWVSVRRGERIAVKRPLLRALLLELASRRGSPEQRLVSRDELIATLWPEEALAPSVAANRLSVALSTLRRMGLNDAIVSTSEGVGFDPSLTIILVDPEGPDRGAPGAGRQ